MKIRFPHKSTFPAEHIGKVLAHVEGRCCPFTCPVHRAEREMARLDLDLAHDLARSIREEERPNG